MRYALIENEKVFTVVEQDSLPDIGGIWIDVTDLHVGPGYIYDDATETFSEPVVTKTRLTKLEFRERFTLDEKRMIYTAAKSSVDIQIWLDDLNATTPEPDGTSVDISDARTIAGVQGLEAAGLIGPGRAAQILGA